MYRNRHMGRIALSFWYHLGRQWAEFDAEAMFDGVRGAILRDADVSQVPKPVINEIGEAMEAEMVSLASRKWIPNLVPSSNDPRIKAAAQVAKDQLNYRLEQLEWPLIRRMSALHFAVGGTGLLYSSWDKSYFDLRTVGAPSAVYCSACNLKLYSPEIPISLLNQGINGQPFTNTETIRTIEPEDGEEPDEQLLNLVHCPICQAASPLKPYSPNPKEAAEGNDVFGRPLGVQEPRGGTILEADIPFEFYPQNGGARISPVSMRRWGRRKIRSMEWVEERYPHLVHLVTPDSPAELLYDDPMLGEWSILGRWSALLDVGILDNHCNVDEVVEQPSFRHPQGRYVVATKDLVLEDSNLLEEEEDESGETLYVPRVSMAVSRYRLRPLELWGTSGPDSAISLQNRLNGIDSQLIEARERLGTPHLFMPKDMWLDNPIRMVDGWGGGKIFLFEPSISQPQFTKPEIFGGTLFPQDVYLERDRVQNDLRRHLGPSDVKSGMAPKNIGTTSGLQVLLEQDEVSRSLREDEFVGSSEKAWQHLLQLEWVLRIDEDVYRVLGPDNAWKYEQYTGLALRGQTEVKIERAPFVGKSVVRREAAREALADQLVAPDSPISRRRLLDAYGLSDLDLPVNEEETNQIDQAERQWVDFVDKGIIRVQDSIDDPMIRWKVLGTVLLKEEGQRITEEAGWDEIARAIAGWEQELQQNAILEQQTIAFYGGKLEGPDAKKAYGEAMVAWDQKMDIFQQQQQTHQALSAEAGMAGAALPPPMPPPKPPPPIFLPSLLQDRVLVIWMGMLQKKGIQLEPQPDPSKPLPLEPPKRTRMSYVKFRALVEAYRLSSAGPMLAPPPNLAGAGAPGPPGPPAGQAPANTGKVGKPQPTAPMPEGGRS